MSRVYVSSTFQDLQDHRRAVSLSIKRLGHADVAMEYYVAEPGRPLDRCLADAGSADLYLGIFARRYGFVPPGYDRSITELELRQAQRNGVDCLCFLLDDQVEWPAEWVEQGPGAERLAALRAEITDRYLAGVFRSADELGAIATASIYRAFDPGRTPFDARREHRLVREWTSAPSPRERVRAGQALAGMGSPRYVAEIKRLLLVADEEADVQRIAHYLDELQHLAASRRELMPIFLDLLEGDDRTRRYFAVFELGELALRGRTIEPQVLDAILRMVDDPSPFIRGELAHTLGKLTSSDRRHPGVRSTLDRLAVDDDDRVRARAVESLERF